ncbi:MAG: CsgG/HfaB family protein [Chloroflexi bacterium]|nr:CsgG/HfaB family protein [Chloroflexota bacterium]
MKKLIILMLVGIFLVCSICCSRADDGKQAPMKKLRIAVMDMYPKAAGSDAKVGDVLSEMVITALVKTGKYIVLERKEINSVLAEQNLGKSGAVTAQTAAQAGKLLGAQAVVTGTITEYTWFSSGAGVVIKGIGLGSKNAKLAVDLRIVDTSTGEIIAAETATGISTSTALGAGGTIGDTWVAGGFASNEPMGKAARDAVGKIIKIITEKTADIPWQARVVKRDDDKIFMNLGENGNINVGDTFNVYSKGEDLVDPETGLSLGAEETLVGRIRINEVNEKYSVGEIENEYTETVGAIKAGDIIRDK